MKSFEELQHIESSKLYWVKSTFFLLSWAFVSGGIILVNKYIFVKDNFPYPIAVSATGPLCSWIVATLLIGSGRVTIENRMTRRGVRTIIIPIGLFTAITFASGNTLYLYLSVSFIQMIKSLSPVVVFVVLVLLGMDKPTLKDVWGSKNSGSGFGMMVACLSESRLTSIGIMLIALSESSECFRMVFFSTCCLVDVLELSRVCFIPIGQFRCFWSSFTLLKSTGDGRDGGVGDDRWKIRCHI